MYTGIPSIDAALKEFTYDMEGLVDLHGEEQVEKALYEIIPELGMESDLDFFNLDRLDENILLETKGIIKRGVDWLLGKKKKKSPPVPGASKGGQVATGAAGGVVGKAIKDQIEDLIEGDLEVEVTNVVKTNIVGQAGPLEFTNARFESLMAQTNELVAETNKILTVLTRELTGGFDDLDLSVDSLVAAETGESLASIQGRQATGAAEDTPTPPPTQKKSKK